jgi:uncharacterized protein YbaP (TraB family)
MTLKWRGFFGQLGLACLACVATAPAAAAAKPKKVVPVVQDYEPKPAIWLLADADTKIYLFGTIHMLPPGFKWRSAAVGRAIAEADELVVETVDEPGSEEDEAAMAQLILETPMPILDRVPPKKHKALKRAIKASGLPSEAYDHLQTWAAAFMMGLGQTMTGYGVDGPDDAPGVEDGLEAEFKAAGKPILSVEDPGPILTAVNTLPARVQQEMLIAAIDGTDEGPAESAKMDRLWATGDSEALNVEGEDDLPPALYDILVTKRNAAWTDWLIARLEKPGTVLFAVGAGHLAGKDKVQTMLEARGHAARRLN